MIDSILRTRLRPLLQRRRRVRFLLAMGGVWLLAAVAAWILLVWQRHSGDSLRPFRLWLPLGALGASVLAGVAAWLSAPDSLALAKQIERLHPDLDGRLLTALEQESDGKGAFNFLQERLLLETIQHSHSSDWGAAVPHSTMVKARIGLVAAVAVFIAGWSNWLPLRGNSWNRSAPHPESEFAVTPGNISLEKGSNLVVLVRFGKAVPGTAELVIGDKPESEIHLPLTKNLNDPVFGGSVPNVQQPLTYRIESATGRTQSYQVTVFEYPRLERSDLTQTFPDYTGQPPKRIPDTRRSTAVEGTRLDVDLQLNKPVASAMLEPQSQGVEPIYLTVDPDKAVASIRSFVPTKSGTWTLILTDGAGRKNKKPVPFSFEVVPNRPPELKLLSPRGDQRPSPLQEMLFDATAWDDFGVVAYGLNIARVGEEAQNIELGKEVPGKEKRCFQHILRLEELGAQPDQLFSWHLWADDLGPDGKTRRTTGDLFFGEVRHFEEIFRDGSGQEGGEQQQSEQQQGQQGGRAAELAKLQKQIITATWKVQKTSALDAADKYRADVKVLSDSQHQAREKAEAASEESRGGADVAARWEVVKREMDHALDFLEKSPLQRKELAAALNAEQAAYQALLKLQAKEHEVMRRSRQQGGPQSEQSGGEQQQQEQLNQLDLAKEENRYERQRQAESPQSAERKEQAQVLNRLQELAKRQEDLNEKLKELQSSLTEAKTDEEREEARRELKRLEEEQRQMLADADELQQRMERPENQSRMSEERNQLEEARENLQQAAEAAQQAQAGQALAAGTRAQRQMQEMRDQLRQKNAAQYEEALRQMRQDARELARKQEEISKQLAENERPRQKSLAEPSNSAETRQSLANQRERTSDLVKRAEELSAETENAEPLLSRQLYDTARQFAQDDAGAVKELQQQMLKDGELTNRMFERMRELQESEAPGKSLALTEEMLQQNRLGPAQQLAEKAGQNTRQLRAGVEKAAESVLGDDTAALHRAEQQIQAAAEALKRELASKEANDARPLGKDDTQGQPSPNTNSPGDLANAEPPTGNQPSTTPQQEQQPPGSQGGAPPEGTERPGDASTEASPRTASNHEEQSPSSGQRSGENAGLPSSAMANGSSPSDQLGGPSSEQKGSRGQPSNSASDSVRRFAESVAENRGGSGPQQGFEIVQERGGWTRPITGDGFANWTDGLREAEEMLDFPNLRNEVASAREKARQLRLEMKRDQKKPDWAVVQLEILKPLVEVQQRLREELTRRESDKALVPIDRDPVPGQFSEVVRRYYEQLGKDQ